MYADKELVVRNPEKIRLGTGIDIGCANNRVMNQTGKGRLPFDNLPEGTKEVKLFHDMHSPLLSSDFVKDGDIRNRSIACHISSHCIYNNTFC
mmetsp:Transcript_2235/g.2563  ORF Transcript_2235/g.2563 Transcript_2235/m.2563 type:complete len:93 (-) Transcript_2235:167-445(-)